MQFKVRDQEYFLTFVEQEKRWFVFSPTTQGLQRIPIYVDEVTFERPELLEAENFLPS